MKKIISLILCLAFLSAIVCGCKPSDAGSSSDTNAAATETNAETRQPSVPPEDDLCISDMYVNYEKNPSCIETPSFSWSLSSGRRGAHQTSYRIRVGKSKNIGLQNTDLVWDSGDVISSETVNIPCGADLDEAARYYWNVTVTDDKSGVSSSETSYFDTALINNGFDGANWIMQDTSAQSSMSFDDCNWIWLLNGEKQGSVPVKTEYFRYSFNISKEVEEAFIAFTADDYGDLYINGETVISIGSSRGWENAVCIDAVKYLKTGDNLIACSCVNKQEGYGAVLIKLFITFKDGTKTVIASDSNWLASEAVSGNWYETGADESTFSKVNSVTEYGAQPWNNNVDFPDMKKAAPTVRGEFEVKSGVSNAFLFASAAGLYDAYINGKKAGNDVLDPGRSEYDKRIMYQCIDVTDMLKEGKNAVGAVLGRGWYIGANSPYGGKYPAFICKLVIDYENGERQIVCSDESWKCTLDGPILYDDIFNGETYDARRELTGWSLPGYDDSSWINVKATDNKKLGVGKLVPQLSGTVKIMDTVPAKEMTEPKKNTYVYDFGQNLAGTVTVKLKGGEGTVVKLRHAEMLNDGSAGSDGPEGTVYVANLRSALASDTYTLKGDPDGETYTPTFTFHGFRYVEITGLKEPPALSDVTANVIYSDMEDTGNINTSDPLVNQLISNTYWGQRGNFLSTPTDCPQRDERMGWSGDAQIFSGTAAYNMNVKAFFDKYITDLNDCQRSDGSYPDVAPQTYRAAYTGSGNNAWGDAGIIIPWTMYVRYGDISYIEKYYGNMKRYIKYLVGTSKDFIRGQSAYGDWLSIGESTRIDVTDTAYCAYVCDLMSKMAALLGNGTDADRFAEYAQNYKDAWNKKYVRAKGVLRSDTQTSYLVALAFNIVPEEDRQLYADKLNEKILNNGTKLTTGFIGCPLLLPVLCEYGHTDTAFALLQQTEYPSWKYPILQGATTIWERWNSYTKSDGFGNAGMNSFNHYSYGSVTEWIYSSLIGITCDEANPGFSHFILKPVAGGGLSYANGEYKSVRGTVKSGWQAENDVMTKYTCTVPANTTATLYLLTDNAANITESGKPLSEAEGVSLISFENGAAVIELASGAYSFEISK
ncbi:MAG: family 78 glycoside hydrolase catalytic domain [Clostridia bacterium]|nr:family 78 glycoside hydrolase catalytic domain [Clostridia bacterium]